LNLAQALNQTTGKFRQNQLEEAHNEAVVLLCYLLKLNKASLYARPELELTEAQLAELDSLVERRLGGEPAAYIVKQKEFYGIDIYIDHRVLIPRPETEAIVEEAVKFARRNPGGKKESQKQIVIADVGTGSGAIAIALARQLPYSLIYAIDISRPALEVAALNVKRQSLMDRIVLLQGDLLQPVDAPLDIVVANLPYIASAIVPQLAREIALHEPRIALDGGLQGTSLFSDLIGQVKQKLNPGGVLLMEIGKGQDRDVASMIRRAFPGAKVSFIRDLQGINRVIMMMYKTVDRSLEL
jgi:release factor glutamine methyltransferase